MDWINVIGAAVTGLLGGYVAGYGVRDRAQKKPKYPCPWDHCGYPLSESPLVSEYYTKNNHFSADYLPEPCPGCGNKVYWDCFHTRYLRHRKPEPQK